MPGTTGGGENLIGHEHRSPAWGEINHLTRVSMCGAQPQFTNIAISGICEEDFCTTEKITWLTPKYFRANKKISPEEAEKLRQKGIFIEEPDFHFPAK